MCTVSVADHGHSVERAAAAVKACLVRVSLKVFC